MPDLLHITELSTWERARAVGEYRTSTRGASLEEVGFIHCSGPGQLRPVAEYLYGAVPDELIVLVIDADRLDAPVRYEVPEPGSPAYPHVYGPIPVDAVTRVVAVLRDGDGRMVLPD